MNSPASRSASSPPPVKKDSGLAASVVICTRHRPDDLRRCLKAISTLHRPPDEVLVVDNTAGDRETERAAREVGARYVVASVEGLSRARNLGMAESRHEIVVYVDDDAVPTGHWLEDLIEPFTDPSVAAVTGETVPPESAGANRSHEPPRRLCNRDLHWFEIATFGGLGIGANMALRKSACAGLKIFDERLGRGAPFRIGEESYAFASLIARGYSAVHVHKAIVVHRLKPRNIAQEAKCSIAYWLLLFSEFPGHRLDLIRFLLRRLRRRPLPWPRIPQEAGDIISSSWRTRLQAAMAGILLFLRTPKPRD
ncbi:MAG: glycosyltransferase family 2 protein [Acidobacteriota bacterium]|nr:glycosyltransferase family 2 protein [Acidobacteriota bacterium]